MIGSPVLPPLWQMTMPTFPSIGMYYMVVFSQSQHFFPVGCLFAVNQGFVPSGFEGSKFLRKFDPAFWQILNYCKLTIYQRRSLD